MDLEVTKRCDTSDAGMFRQSVVYSPSHLDHTGIAAVECNFLDDPHLALDVPADMIPGAASAPMLDYSCRHISVNGMFHQDC